MSLACRHPAYRYGHGAARVRGCKLTVPSGRIELAYRVAGFGPPIVLVHGTAADGATFRLLERQLADRYTVVTVDRRGRFGSGDEDAYSIEAEFDDLAAVVDTLREPAIVFGHSFGGNVALGASLRSSKFAKLVLYEPGRRGDVPPALHQELERLLARDDRMGAMRLTLLEFTRFPEEWLDDLLETPPWQERLAYAHTIPRELRAYDEYDYGDLSRYTVPTLLMVGEESPASELAHARHLASELPSARISVLPGEGHVAPVTAPQLLAREISQFAAA
jgi:pimeloyl-ACP methyl ester carboxylesterase